MVNLLKYLAVLAWCMPAFVQADVISPRVQAARERLAANPNLFDRFDTFCAGKRNGSACVIPGTTFSGGGKGVCTTDLDGEDSGIDLTCVRTGLVAIDRKLPAGGFVHDEYMCGLKARATTDKDLLKESRHWNCTPLKLPPTDIFCKDKTVGNRCTVELDYQGNKESHDGVCKVVTETNRFYYHGHRTSTRDVIQCEPEHPVMHQYTPASWRQKLRN